MNSTKLETILFIIVSYPVSAGTCTFSKYLLNWIDYVNTRERRSTYIYYISIMCQALCWYVKWDNVYSLHNTPCKLSNFRVKTMRNSNINYLQIISFTLDKENSWNFRAMPSSGIWQRTWLCNGFSALTSPWPCKFPDSAEDQQVLAGSLGRDLLHGVPWLIVSWQEFHFMNLKINHSFINKEILLPSIKFEMTKYKSNRTKVIFLFAWKKIL